MEPTTTTSDVIEGSFVTIDGTEREVARVEPATIAVDDTPGTTPGWEFTFTDGTRAEFIDGAPVDVWTP